MGKRRKRRRRGGRQGGPQSLEEADRTQIPPERILPTPWFTMNVSLKAAYGYCVPVAGPESSHRPHAF